MSTENSIPTKRSRILDGQAYIASTDFLPREFVEGIAANTCVWMSAQGIPTPRERVLGACLSYFDDPWCDTLVAQMDKAGIAKTVLMCPDFTYVLPNPKYTIAEIFAHHHAVMQRHPDRFLVMGCVDPRWGGDGISLFEKAVTEYGFHGLKLYPPCGYTPSDEVFRPYYDLCREYRLPVSVHCGGTAPVLRLDNAYPRMVDAAALAFPEVNFILSHASSCYTEECLMLCTSRPNIYLDVSGFAAQPIGRLNALFQYGVNHKIIFATDWPSFRGQGPQSRFVDMVLSDNGPLPSLREFEVSRFLHGTLESLLPYGAATKTEKIAA